MALYTHHLPRWKKEEVETIKRGVAEHTLVGVVDMYGIPASQVQQIRRNLRGTATVKMARNTLIEHAFTELGGDVEGLKEHAEGQSALIFTDENPFKLFKLLEKTKTKMAAKPGETAPEDLVVPKGPTSFKPGPIVGELQKAGIPAAIEGGKIVIRKDKVLVEKGHKVPEELAKILPKLEILPMIVGMDLKGAFEDGIVYQRDILNVPVGYYPTMLATAARNATALGVSIVYPTKQTIGPLLGKAYRGASAVGVKAAIPTKDTIGPLLAKARAEMLAIAAQVPGLEDDRLKQQLTVAAAPAPQEKKVEKKEEEKKPEVSEEEAAAGLSALFG